jgi:hypothetical protein
MSIDSFDLRNPLDYEELVCFLPPLASVVVGDDSSLTSSAFQDIFLTVRYPANVKYQELPLDKLEGTLISLQLRLLKQWVEIAPLIDLNVLSLDQPIKVVEFGDSMADWLVTLNVRVEIAFNAEFEEELDNTLSNAKFKVAAKLYSETIQPGFSTTKRSQGELVTNLQP